MTTRTPDLPRFRLLLAGLVLRALALSILGPTLVAAIALMLGSLD